MSNFNYEWYFKPLSQITITDHNPQGTMLDKILNSPKQKHIVVGVILDKDGKFLRFEKNMDGYTLAENETLKVFSWLEKF